MNIVWVGYFNEVPPGHRTDDERMCRAFERAACNVFRCERPWDDLEGLIARTSADWVIFSVCPDFDIQRLVRLRESVGRPGLAQVLFDLMDFRERVIRGFAWPTRSRLPRWIEMAKHLDLVFVKERGHLDRYAAMGIHGVYVDQACDPEDEPAESFPDSSVCDIAFFGRIDSSRISHLRSMKPVGRTVVYSNRWWKWSLAGFDARPAVYGNALAERVAAARIVYGESARHDVAGYWSDRVYRILGHRGFFLTKFTPGLEASFVNHEHLVWFERSDDLRPLAQRYLADPESRQRIAEAGFRHVRENHTYDHRVREILSVLAKTPHRP